MTFFDFMLKMMDVHPGWLALFMLWGIVIASLGVTAVRKH